MRLSLLKRITLALFFILILSLAYHLLLKGDYYIQLSQNNRIKLLRIPAARGLIYGRKQELLAGQRLVFNLAILAQEIEDFEQTLQKLGSILDIAPERLLEQYRREFLAPFVPVVIARDIPKELAIALECKESDIPGLIVQTEPLRDYRYGEEFCHILGYLGKVDEKEFTRGKSYGLQVKDLVGKSGLEQEFDDYLRGQAGGMQIEVNNRGHLVRVLGSKQSQAGKNLYLTIEVQLQEFIRRLLEQKAGACIVLNPQKGEILAMVSQPGFDPTLFIAALNAKSAAAAKVEELLSSKEAALLNRATSGTYSPGSIFKIILAAAGLESGTITTQTTVQCSGSLKVGNRDFFCWKLDGHGRQNIYMALANSCNVFFYKLGLALGPDKISLFARKFGLGKPTLIDLPYESRGLVPSKGWKLATYKERWYDGETANLSIGQGYLLTTPLQIAQMVSGIANGGYLIRPHIVKRIGGQEIGLFRQKLNLKEGTIEVIKEGMRQVSQNKDGTGHKANIPGVQCAAKTGTTQTAKGPAHGWFAGFYPFNEPQILVLVFLEYGGSGGETPAKIAKEIVNYIIENKI